MLFLLGGQDKKARKPEAKKAENHERVKDLFLNGKFPVVTTDVVEGKHISKVLGLVCCRGYDSDEAFFGMASRAVNKGAHSIVGYCENVAFHPDGSKYFSCFGTAVMFEWEQEEKYGAAALRENPLRMAAPRVSNESAAERPPHPRRVDDSNADVERMRAQRVSDASTSERPPRMTARPDDSSERPSRLSAHVGDDNDFDELPPLRPVGASPSWHRS